MIVGPPPDRSFDFEETPEGEAPEGSGGRRRGRRRRGAPEAEVLVRPLRKRVLAQNHRRRTCRQGAQNHQVRLPRWKTGETCARIIVAWLTDIFQQINSISENLRGRSTSSSRSRLMMKPPRNRRATGTSPALSNARSATWFSTNSRRWRSTW